MKRYAIGTNLNLESNSWKFNERGARSDYLNVNNARGDCSNNTFTAVYNTRVEVDITNKRDHTADLKILFVRRMAGDVNCFKVFCGGNLGDVVRGVFDEMVRTELGVQRVGELV